MTWALGIGRVLVILTEVVALSAFLYRFSLDRQLIDLHDTIKSKQAIINLLKKSEDTYRNLQNRLALAKTLIQSENLTNKTITDILSLAPSDVLFTNFTLSGNQIIIEVKTQSIASLRNFVNVLKSYPQISSVDVNKIENRTTSGVIIMGINASLKNSVTQNSDTNTK